MLGLTVKHSGIVNVLFNRIVCNVKFGVVFILYVELYLFYFMSTFAYICLSAILNKNVDKIISTMFQYDCVAFRASSLL